MLALAIPVFASEQLDARDELEAESRSVTMNTTVDMHGDADGFVWHAL